MRWRGDEGLKSVDLFLATSRRSEDVDGRVKPGDDDWGIASHPMLL